MSDISPGRALRDLKNAQASLRKVREAVRLARESGQDPERAGRAAWQTLCAAHETCARLPWSAADDEVILRQAALLRYAASLLVRLRRGAGGSASNPLEADQAPGSDDDL